MAALPGLTNARVMAATTSGLGPWRSYTFWVTPAERPPSFLPVQADKASHAVARVVRGDILPKGGSAVLRPLPDEDALLKCGYTPGPRLRLYKALSWHLARGISTTRASGTMLPLR